MGELRKPVLLNAGPRQGACLWSVVAVHPWLRQLLKPLEFARKAASAGAVSWCVAGGRIGPGSQGSSSHPKGSRSAFNLGGGGGALPASPLRLQPRGLFPWPHSDAGMGERVSPSPHGISPGITAAFCRLLFPLAEGKYSSSSASRGLLQSHRCTRCSCPLELKLLRTRREDPNLHPTKVMEKVALNWGFLCAWLCCVG